MEAATVGSVVSTDAAPGFDIRHYLRILRRRRLLIAVTAFLILALAVLLSLTQTPKYDASAEILFTSTPSPLNGTANTVSFEPARELQTQVAVLTSSPVRKLVASALHINAAPPVSASPVLNANAIQVKATSTDAVEAARVANAYANAYIEYRKSHTVNDLLDAEQLIQTRITDLQHQIDGITGQINSAPQGTQTNIQATLVPQRDALLSQQSALKQQLDQSQLQSAFASTGAQLGNSATIPTSPSSPHPVSSGISALIFGLFAGIALAFIVDFADDSIKTHEDAERAAYGLSTLGLLPSVRTWKSKGDPVLVSLSAPTSPAAEAYRGLRTAIQFASLDRSLRVIQVTSPGATEGKTTTLANLAVAFGRVGSRVCAVDADLRRPRLHAFFQTSGEPGFTSVVHGELPLSAAVGPTSASDLWVLSSGPPPLDPSEVLASPRTKGVLASLAGQYDIVLVDSPPVLPVTDASVLSRQVDAVVVVVDAGRTKKRALTRAIELLRQVDAPILGLIVNRANEESRYGYTYDYRGGEPTKAPEPSPTLKRSTTTGEGAAGPRSPKGKPRTGAQV